MLNKKFQKNNSFLLKNEKVLTEKLFLVYGVLRGYSLKATLPDMYENITGLNFTNNTFF